MQITPGNSLSSIQTTKAKIIEYALYYAQAYDLKIQADLVFPQEVVLTTFHPDMIILSRCKHLGNSN